MRYLIILCFLICGCSTPDPNEAKKERVLCSAVKTILGKEQDGGLMEADVLERSNGYIKVKWLETGGESWGEEDLCHSI